MSPMFLGLDANRKPVYLSSKTRQSTHMHVVGSSGTGKSKFLEWLIRQDITNRQGVCVIDWHGTLYNDVLEWCHHKDVGIFDDDRSIVLLNPSQPDFITGFNPFVAGTGDISVQVSRRVDATIRPWGVTNTNETPTFARICRALYTFMIEQSETLPNAALLLQFKNQPLREYAARTICDTEVRAEWEDLQTVKKLPEWQNDVLSTKNRLNRFVGSNAIKRFMGLTEGNLNLLDIMDKQKILIVNLGSSDFLDREAARVFASLLINEFFEITMRRANRVGSKPLPFNLYLDEFQEYITDDIASMLDEVRKGGLHIVLAHQHLGHFTDNARLRKSVLVNARLRAVFGGLDYEDACVFGNEMFLPDLNTRQIKKAYYHTVHVYREETRQQVSEGSTSTASWSTAESHGSGYGTTATDSSGAGESTSTSGPTEGWFSRSSSTGSSESESEFSSQSEVIGGSDANTRSVTTGTVFVPIPIQELGSESEWTREEKLSKIVEMLKVQQQRHCFIKLDLEPTQPLRVPDVSTPNVEPDTLVEYQGMLYKRQGGRPAGEIDRLLLQSRADFLIRAGMDASPTGNDETKAKAFSDSEDDFFGQ